MATSRILIVEDEAIIRLPIEEALVDRGFECRCASTMDRAHELARSEQFSAAILDININGEMVFPLARELVARDVHCMFTTGYMPDSVPEEFADVPFFQKPYKVDELVEAVVGCVSGKKAD